ncbi:hypothetical protein ACX1C1_16860 [Paenibacillus sp. strain BS8-2]
MEAMRKSLERWGMHMEMCVNRYEGSRQVSRTNVSWNAAKGSAKLPGGEMWEISVDSQGRIDDKEGLELAITFHALEGCEDVAVMWGLRCERWSDAHYVLVPGAVYDGNRFPVQPLAYAPCWSLLPREDRGPQAKPYITDVPRLSNVTGEQSAFHLLTGDASVPAIGLYDAGNAMGWLLMTDQSTVLGDSSMHVEESLDRGEARLVFQAPGIRPETKYEMTTTRVDSPDRGRRFEDGESVTVRCRLFQFPCHGIEGLFERLGDVRQLGMNVSPPSVYMPFSAAWTIQEDKYNTWNWKEKYGYYSVGTVDMKHQDWQVGWVGGGMSSYALLAEGSALSVERALSTLAFMLGSQTESGFFQGVFYNGEWYGDEFNGSPDRDYPEQWHIVRKSADALYFVMKHLIWMEQMRPEQPIPVEWLASVRRLADAFVKLWHQYKDFGQWVHTGTGELLVGGSAAGSIVPAGLALCAEYFEAHSYREVALESAEQYYERFTAKGISTGGPGEILQCPDSESAFALLESFVVLMESTGDKHWSKRAEEAADQAMSWCVAYDFRFPQNSTFGRLGIRTLGSVIANVQNKHSAPGICTLSGDSLLKLYRATGKLKYLELLRDIASHLPQYLSTNERPIVGWDGNNLLQGYMSERVNMSDWEGSELVGEVLPLSCWCEVSMMLSFAELPGIYVDRTRGRIVTLDGVDCNWEQMEELSGLIVSNPHDMTITVKLLVEGDSDRLTPLGACPSPTWQRVELAPGEILKVSV